MFCKTSFLLVAMLLALGTASAQLADLGEKKPATINGVEYGYIIKNEQTKAAKGEEYGRFEITLYATNKSGCTKLFAERTSIYSSDDPSLLVTYNCTNANGKRLTAKSGTVKARDFNVNVKVKEADKEVTRLVKAGYMFRNGETLKTNIIVLVPLNERPVINCSLNQLPEIQ
jgi:opacity protein-like surface antigen